jgi:hypothetical protein
MTDASRTVSEPPRDSTAEAAPSNGVTPAASTNGQGQAPTAAGQPAPSDAASETRLDRAEKLADQVGERAAKIVGAVAFGFLRFLARAREEAEDVWAEAQHIRRGDKS